MNYFASQIVTSATVAAVIAALVQGCGPSPAHGTACVPGTSIMCVGPATCSGDQVCASDGRSYGACQCGAPGPDAGDAATDAQLDSGAGANDATLADAANGAADAQVPNTSDGGPDGGNTLLGNAVLFGGLSESDGSFVCLSDTWTFDGTSWTQLNVTGPPGRELASIASLDGGLVLFGGVSCPGTYLSDTWIWSGSAWTQANVSGPGTIAQAGMASLNNTVVLFG